MPETDHKPVIGPYLGVMPDEPEAWVPVVETQLAMAASQLKPDVPVSAQMSSTQRHLAWDAANYWLQARADSSDESFLVDMESAALILALVLRRGGRLVSRIDDEKQQGKLPALADVSTPPLEILMTQLLELVEMRALELVETIADASGALAPLAEDARSKT